MAYVGNIMAFVKYMIDNVTTGYNVFNYIDKPDMTGTAGQQGAEQAYPGSASSVLDGDVRGLRL